MIVGLASPGVAASLDDGLDRMKRLMSEAAGQGAEIVCFPEAYLPGLRGQDFDVFPFDRAQQERALEVVGQWARTYAVATILGMERLTEAGRQIAAVVIDARGQRAGIPDQEPAGPERGSVLRAREHPATLRGQRPEFGVAICHEGWRYPETVRWAAVRGAKIVFHPHSPGATGRASVRRSGARPADRTTRRR